MEELAKLYNTIGSIGMIYMAFIGLVIWIVKKYDRNEERLYKIIDTLSTKFESIEGTLKEIKFDLDKGKR